MNLKTKLYMGFLAMILLAVILGVLAVVAFRTINDNVAATNDLVEHNATRLTPLTGHYSTLAASVAEAGGNFYAYTLSHSDAEFNDGTKALDACKTATAGIESIVAAAPPDTLLTARRNVVDISALTRDFENVTHELKEEIAELASIQANMNTAAVRAVDSVTDAFAEVRKRMEMAIDEDAEEQTEEDLDEDMKRRNARMQLLMDVLDNLSESRVGFWKAQTMDGDAAAAEYTLVIGLLADSLKLIKEYNVPANIQDDKTAANFNRMYSDIDDYRNGVLQVQKLSATISATATRTIELYKSIDGSVTEAASAAGVTMNEISQSIFSGMTTIEKTVGSYRALVLTVAIVALVLGLVIATLLIRGITRPISHIIDVLTNGSDQINAASGQIASASRNLAEGATSQAASLEETSSALEQMASMTRQNADNAKKTNDTTEETARMVGEGSEAVSNMTAAMADISDKSEKVERIVKTIEDIAFQTNLLALNAAVEAARAGEAGKGFAVVADEVRNLSQRSAQAAKDTTELITGTIESVRNGSTIASHLSESFSAIEESAQQVSQLIREITAATNEQAQGVDQVNTAVAQMDKVTQQNAADSEETASSSEELSRQSVSLVAAIQELRTLVYGGSGGSQAAGAPPAGKPPRPSPARRAQPLPDRRRALPGGSESAKVAKVDPSTVIPLDDDFGDF